jgi:hypothetical protein
MFDVPQQLRQNSRSIFYKNFVAYVFKNHQHGKTDKKS